MSPKLQKILYVDDDADVQKLVKLTLESAGLGDVMTCSNGIDFMLSAFEDVPDMILLDVMMDTMSGTEIMREIRQHENLAQLPVVFITSRAEPADIEKYMALGAVGVVAKPFELASLAERIQALWRKHYGI